MVETYDGVSDWLAIFRAESHATDARKGRVAAVRWRRQTLESKSLRLWTNLLSSVGRTKWLSRPLSLLSSMSSVTWCFWVCGRSQCLTAPCSAAAFATRLFSVLRFESVIHEFDP